MTVVESNEKFTPFLIKIYFFSLPFAGNTHTNTPMYRPCYHFTVFYLNFQEYVEFGKALMYDSGENQNRNKMEITTV